MTYGLIEFIFRGIKLTAASGYLGNAGNQSTPALGAPNLGVEARGVEEMGLFSKASKAAAKVAVTAATAATTSLGGSYAKHYVQSQKHIARSGNSATKVVTRKTSK